MTEVKKKLYEAIGFSIVSMLIVGGSIAVVYLVIGELTDTGRHILATALVFTTIGAYLLGLQVARSHKQGFKQALDMRLDVRQPAKQLAPKPATAAATSYADILPAVPRANIIMRTDTAQNTLDI